MSAPRKPFGAHHPGRVPATMMKVLAAEMSDPQRLRRGKQYAASGAVVDIVVEPGQVTCEVLGSRSTPYIATLGVKAGDGMPLRRHLRTACTCPDLEDPWTQGDSEACKHVVAAMFAFSDELLQEPELLDVWRGATGGPAPDAGGEDAGEVSGADAAGPDDTGDHGARPDPLRLLLAAAAPLPELPPLGAVEPPAPTDPELAAILHDALAHLRVDWT